MATDKNTLLLVLCLVLLFHEIGSLHPAIDNSTKLYTTMGFDGGGLFLSELDCPDSYVCPNPLESKSKVLPKWDALNCQCDDACSVYGDCCVNAKYYHQKATKSARQLWKCVKLVEYEGLYMQTKCPPSWSVDGIRQKCEVGGVLDAEYQPASDPLAMTPVTSLVTRYTYQNFYCAYCSGDVERIIYWIPRIECDNLLYYNSTYGNISEEYVWSRLKFHNESAQWGVFLDNGTASTMMRPPAPPPTYLSTVSPNANFVTCRIMVQMPTNVVDMVRQCKPWIDDCPANTSANHSVVELCHSYTAAIYDNSDQSYRNIHCALCNDEDVSALNCNGGLLYRNVQPAAFTPSFAFLFDVNENSGNMVGTLNRCKSSDEVYDPFFKICRQMVCLDSTYVLQNGKCVLNQPANTETSTSTTTTSTTTTLTGSSTTLVPNQISTDKEWKNISIVIEPAITNSSHSGEGIEEEDTTTIKTVTDFQCPRFNIARLHYHMYDNGSLYIDEYERKYDSNEYTVKADGSILICMSSVTDDLDNFYRRKFSVVLAYLTLACLGISLTCLLFHLAAFTQVPSLRNLSGKNLASLCVALVIAYVTFILAQFQETVSTATCTSVGVILYYSFLASFFWMNAISYDVWRTLRLATSELRVSSGQQWRKFIIYSAYAWFGAAVIVVAAIVVENSDRVPQIYKPSFGLVTCWFGSRRALLLFFVAPIICIVLANVLLFVLSAYIIVSTTRNSAVLNPSSKARRNFRLYLRLALIMGMSWTFGIIAGQVDREALWYIFVILNALQGLFIFLSFTCTQKVRVHLRNRLLCHRNQADYYSANRNGKHPKKFELEGRDSGSGESQSSQTSHLSLSKTGSQVSKASTDTLY